MTERKGAFSDRLRELETTIKRLENEINEEKCKNYSYLTREEVEAYLETVVVNDPDTLEPRKAITNTFIREIVVYKDKLIITYNFTKNKEPIRVDKEETKDLEERSKSASLFILKFCSPICINREPAFSDKKAVAKKKSEIYANLVLFFLKHCIMPSILKIYAKTMLDKIIQI